MDEGFRQTQEQRQTMVLAPQLRQSLKILQVPALELRNTILEELESNPTLEELPMDGVSIDEETTSKDTETERHEEIGLDENFEVLKKLSEDWEDYYTQESSQYTDTKESAIKRQHFFNSFVSETSLEEHLMEQTKLSECSEDEKKAIAYLVGSLDDHGFLTATWDEIADMTELPVETVMSASEVLKGFDPPGIGCSNVQESLMLQLRLRGDEESLAYTIIDEYYDLLLRRRIPDLARKTGTSVDEIQEAIEHISALDPAPGRAFGEDTNSTITPDICIEKIDGVWSIILTSDYIPRLRINPIYKKMIAKGTLSSQEKEYIQTKMRSSKFLMGAIEQRQNTLERIAKEILKFQYEFFEEGVSKLKPLTMNEVAEVLGVHETTVSRAIANKYVETPHGTFELRYFFTSGYQNSEGQTVANTSIKEKIAAIIEAEDTSKPYSDQEIVNILQEKGIKIARRTVAKYREELGILATNLRRQY